MHNFAFMTLPFIATLYDMVCDKVHHICGPNIFLDCPAEYSENEGSCYKLSTGTADYDTAQAACEAEGGNLAVITSQDEHNYAVMKAGYVH